MINTSDAAEQLPQMLKRFHAGEGGPFIVGQSGQPEAVVIPWDVWQRLAVLAAETEDFDHVDDIVYNVRSLSTDDWQGVAAKAAW